MSSRRLFGWARYALPILLALSCATLARAASCILPVPIHKDRPVAASFQHITPSPSAFFALHWNSTGDSALPADRVPRILAALDSARSHFSRLPGMWDIPLGPRSAYPVLALPQSTPGATTLPFELDGTGGLTWIQLDTDFSRWGGQADLLLDATCAHELFHAVQFAQGADLRDLAFYEASAVWAEDQCFPDHDDWAWRYLPHLLEHLHTPWDATDGLREYGAGAVVKHLLHEDWTPCRDALRQADATQRCWPLLLERLADPQTDMARVLAELLQAGNPAITDWRVPELAGALPVQRPRALALHPGADIPPAAEALSGLSWLAMPVEASGALEACASPRPFLLDGVECQPLSCDSLTAVRAGEWLVLVNTEEAAHGGLQELEWSTALHIWPNPGGAFRQVRFDHMARPLEICNLLGQRLALWTPPTEGRGPFLLQLPASATGTLLLREWPSGASLAITHCP
jgi:hypothetical protein